MERNKNMDFVRASAILCIVFYHIYALTKKSLFPFPWFVGLSNYTGEIGVTLFFILSGAGIFISLYKVELKNMQNRGKRLLDFFKKRIVRILPQYYFMLIIMILLTTNAVYIDLNQIYQIILHFFLIHNLFVNTHGSINGAVWALAVIFQFYLIAPLMYKFLQKNEIMTVLISILITITLKIIIFNILPTDIDANFYFIYGRQLLTSLDNFVIGMFVGKLIVVGKIYSQIKSIIIVIIGLIGTVLWALFMSHRVLYANTFLGYIWHSIEAIFLSIFLYAFCKVNLFSKSSKILILFNWIAEYEYGIYLWHKKEIWCLR